MRPGTGLKVALIAKRASFLWIAIADSAAFLSFNNFPPLFIPHGLEYPLGFRMHLDVVHLLLEARGRPFPRSPRSRSRVNLRVLRPLTRKTSGSNLTHADTSRPSWSSGHFPDFLLPGSPWLAHGSPLHGNWFPNPTGLLFGAFVLPSHPMSRSPMPLPVTGPIPASRGFPIPRGCCAARATPLSYPRALSHPSSRVYTPPGRQQPSGAGPQDPHPSMDRFMLLARVAPILSPSAAHLARSPPHVPVRGVWPLVPSPGPIGLPVYWQEKTASPGGCGPAGTPLHVPPLGLGGEVCSVFCMLAPHVVLPSLTSSFRPHMAECPSDVCPSPLMAEGLCFCCSPPYPAQACCCV